MGTAASDVAIVGGGTIGLSIAWRAAQAGLSVVVADPDPSRGAWRTAAGMLAPITELHYAESALLRLNLASLARYPKLIAELESITGLDAGYRECGTVEVAWDAADLAALRDLHVFGSGLGLRSSLLTGAELRQLEPGLAAGLPGGLLAESDHQIDPRRLHRALTDAAVAAGVRIEWHEVTVEVRDGVARGVRRGDGSLIAAGQVVVAAGAWSSQPSVCDSAVPTVRPVKGQTLRLQLPAEVALRHIVRASVKGSTVYVVPRANGEVVIGASSEEAGFDVTPRAGAVYELLRDAQSVLPELGEAALIEVSTGLRPGTADNAPLLGRTAVDGLVLATGHYRNGILLTPVTADGIAELLASGTVAAELAPFGPLRERVPA